MIAALEIVAAIALAILAAKWGLSRIDFTLDDEEY